MPAPEAAPSQPAPQPDTQQGQASARSGEAPQQTQSGNNNPQNKISICHATGSKKNPYNSITLNANGVINGHAGAHHQNGRDIIPPFDYRAQGQAKHFPGQNWDAAGQAIHSNGCKQTPPPDPDPDPVPGIAVTVGDCPAPGSEVPRTAEVTLTSLVIGKQYEVQITGPEGEIDSRSIVPDDDTAVFIVELPGPGTYVATVSGPMGEGSPEFPAPTAYTATTAGPIVDTINEVSIEFTADDCPQPPDPPEPPVDPPVDPPSDHPTEPPADTPVSTVPGAQVPAHPVTSPPAAPAAAQPALVETGVTGAHASLALMIALLAASGGAMILTRRLREVLRPKK
ncbi:hypothetical protein [Leucobacter sp. GX24907]